MSNIVVQAMTLAGNRPLPARLWASVRRWMQCARARPRRHSPCNPSYLIGLVSILAIATKPSAAATVADHLCELHVRLEMCPRSSARIEPREISPETPRA